tara:strand:- start:7546 stop:8325 length:780 start_codon:yes stop_codon:yes gene_type:complete
MNREILSYISASRLKTWQTCRRQFYFRYIAKIETPLSPPLFVGREIHEALRWWNWARWRGESPDRDTLRSEFQDSWNQNLKRETILWKASDDPDKIKEAAWKTLDTYLDQGPVPLLERPEGVEVRIEAELGRQGYPPLLGIIDLIRPNGVIVDYKSSSRAPSGKLVAHQHATQLACYALLYRDATGRNEGGFELHYLIKSRSPKLVVSTFGPLSKNHEEELYQLIDDYLLGISREAWIKSPGQHCAWCDYFDRCGSLNS